MFPNIAVHDVPDRTTRRSCGPSLNLHLRHRHRVSDSASCGCSRSPAKIDNAVTILDDPSRDGVLARERTAVIAFAFTGLGAAAPDAAERRGPQQVRAPAGGVQRWHTDLMYRRITGSWYFLITVLDAYSRYVVHRDLSMTMTAADVRRVIEADLRQICPLGREDSGSRNRSARSPRPASPCTRPSVDLY
jgi:transposase InsO family protein